MWMKSAFVANAGWYTKPSKEERFFGLTCPGVHARVDEGCNCSECGMVHKAVKSREILVSRVLMCLQLRVKAAVAANAGWYTMPSKDEKFPYGFGGCDDFNEEDLVKFLNAPLVLLLGEADTDPK